jgi:hypothetical protein
LQYAPERLNENQLGGVLVQPSNIDWAAAFALFDQAMGLDARQRERWLGSLGVCTGMIELARADSALGSCDNARAAWRNATNLLV